MISLPGYQALEERKRELVAASDMNREVVALESRSLVAEAKAVPDRIKGNSSLPSLISLALPAAGLIAVACFPKARRHLFDLLDGYQRVRRLVAR